MARFAGDTGLTLRVPLSCSRFSLLKLPLRCLSYKMKDYLCFSLCIGYKLARCAEGRSRDSYGESTQTPSSSSSAPSRSVAQRSFRGHKLMFGLVSGSQIVGRKLSRIRPPTFRLTPSNVAPHRTLVHLVHAIRLAAYVCRRDEEDSMRRFGYKSGTAKFDRGQSVNSRDTD